MLEQWDAYTASLGEEPSMGDIMASMPFCLTRLAAAITAMKTLKLSYSGWHPGIEDDLFFRARILEGAAGLPQWSLSGNPRTFLREGPEQFPEIDEEWFASKDLGLAGAAYYTLAEMIKGQGGLVTAEELYQQIISGVGPSTKDDLPVAIGKKYSRKILSGDMGPRVFKPGIKIIVKNRAIDAIKKQRTRDKTLNNPLTIGPGQDQEDPGIDPADVVDTLSPMQAIALIMSGPKGREFLRWAYKTVDTKGSESQKAVFNAYVKDPDASNRQLAEGLGISPQMAGRHRDNALKIIKSEIARNPKILDWVQDALALRHLDDIDAVQMAKLPLRWKLRRASVSRVAWRWVRQAGSPVADLLKDYDKGFEFQDFVNDFVSEVLGGVTRNPRFVVDTSHLKAYVSGFHGNVDASLSGEIHLTVKGPSAKSLSRNFAKQMGRWYRDHAVHPTKVFEEFLSHRKIVTNVWIDRAFDYFNEDTFTTPLLKKVLHDMDSSDVEDQLGNDYEWDGRWFPGLSEVEIDEVRYDPKSGDFDLGGSFTLTLEVT